MCIWPGMVYLLWPPFIIVCLLLSLQGWPHVCRQLPDCYPTRHRVCGVQHRRVICCQRVNHGQWSQSAGGSCGCRQVPRCTSPPGSLGLKQDWLKHSSVWPCHTCLGSPVSPRRRHWQDLGYLIIYVTGRPDMQKQRVVAWLSQHNFPHGIVSFCDGLVHDPLRHKANFLKSLTEVREGGSGGTGY